MMKAPPHSALLPQVNQRQLSVAHWPGRSRASITPPPNEFFVKAAASKPLPLEKQHHLSLGDPDPPHSWCPTTHCSFSPTRAKASLPSAAHSTVLDSVFASIKPPPPSTRRLTFADPFTDLFAANSRRTTWPLRRLPSSSSSLAMVAPAR